MKKLFNFKLKFAFYFVLSLGIIFLFFSAIQVSSFLAILGLSILFLGAIFFYITPTKYFPITLLNAVIISAISNIERIISETNFFEKGRYLPPNIISDFSTSLVLIPKYPDQPLPKSDILKEKIFGNNRNYLLFSPPGMGLSELFEKELNVSFVKKDLSYIQKALPVLLVHNMELAEMVDIQIKDNIFIMKIFSSVLEEIYHTCKKFHRTNHQVGFILSSAVACVLAKVSGKIIIIQKEEISNDKKLFTIEYTLEDTINSDD